MEGRGPSLREHLDDEARALGFSLVGVAGPEPSAHMALYRRWLEAARHGEMAYLAREDAVARRADLTATMADVRSVVVVAHEYHAEDDPAVVADPSRGIIARYARGRDYHRVMKKKLLALLARLDERVEGGVRGRAYVDTGPILERELARRAGLGWFGRNTMLIHPRRGSWLFLGVLLVDVDLPRDAPFEADRCGSCRACLDACPTGALLGRDERGAPVMDATRCISYLTIEQRGPIPPELRPLVGNRIYGCDICQEVCPFNVRFAAEGTEPAYAARGPGERSADDPGTDAPALVDLLRMVLDDASWDSFSRGSPIRRAGRAGFARNVAVALGNQGSADAVPALAAALGDGEPLVRGHAAWALGRVGTEEARAALERRAREERDPRVREEIAAALG